MSQISPPSITASPTAPQRGDRTTFSARVDDFIIWMASAVGQFGAVASNVYSNAVDAYSNAVAGAASASAAAASAASASGLADAVAASAAMSGAALWVSGTSYTVGQIAYTTTPTSTPVYRRVIAGAGTTDPMIDTVNWKPLIPPSVGSTLYLAANFGAL